MPALIFSPNFKKEYKSIVKRNTKLEKKIKQKVKFFLAKPQHSSLRVHKIYSPQVGEVFSFWIEKDLRIIFNWVGKNKVIFYRIGNHKQVY